MKGPFWPRRSWTSALWTHLAVCMTRWRRRGQNCWSAPWPILLPVGPWKHLRPKPGLATPKNPPQRSPAGLDQARRRAGSKDPGLSPFPGAWFTLDTDKGPVRIKALLSTVAAGAGEPGLVLDPTLLVATGEGAVRLLKVQREGKAAQEAEVFLRGTPVPPGTRLR